MRKERQCWVVKDGPAMAAVEEIVARRSAFAQHCRAMALRYGASVGHVILDAAGDRLVALHFKGKGPDASLWRRHSEHPQYYMPRAKKRTTTYKKCKAIRDDLESVKNVGSFALSRWLLGVPYVVQDGRVFVAALDKVGDRYFVLAYRSSDWQPIDGLEEIPASEYWKAVDEHQRRAAG